MDSIEFRYGEIRYVRHTTESDRHATTLQSVFFFWTGSKYLEFENYRGRVQNRFTFQSGLQ